MLNNNNEVLEIKLCLLVEQVSSASPQEFWSCTTPGPEAGGLLPLARRDPNFCVWRRLWVYPQLGSTTGLGANWVCVSQPLGWACADCSQPGSSAKLAVNCAGMSSCLGMPMQFALCSAEIPVWRQTAQAHPAWKKNSMELGCSPQKVEDNYSTVSAKETFFFQKPRTKHPRPFILPLPCYGLHTHASILWLRHLMVAQFLYNLYIMLVVL